jgi:hypothetical protein
MIGSGVKFPAYVPAAVRDHVSRLLPVLTSIIDTPPGQVPHVVRAYFEEHNKTGAHYERKFKSFADEHLATIIEKRPHRNELALHKECLIRIAQDERMREAYTLLATQFSEDESWHKLIWAATTASQDFRTYRLELSHASRACKEIAAACEYIGSLLEEIDNCNVRVPAFYSFYVLMNKEGATYEVNGVVPEDMVWLRVEDILRRLSEMARTTAGEIDNRKVDLSEQYAWRIASFEHNSPQNALVMSALKTRQSNRKTEHLRAFGYGLAIEDPNALTSTVQKAMAYIATVVINDPDIVVTYDDVRAVFTKGKQRAKGKSSKKTRASSPASRETNHQK